MNQSKFQQIDTHNTIQTWSGHYFFFEDPSLGHYTEYDLAHGLANKCRFSGHTRWYYSIAQHCVLAARNVPRADAFEALMHDASEAFMTDVPTPLKRMLPDYRTAEEVVERSIANKYNLRYPYPASVKDIDRKLLRREKEDLMPTWNDQRFWDEINSVELLRFVIEPWDREYAKDAWLKLFNELYYERQANRI